MLRHLPSVAHKTVLAEKQKNFMKAFTAVLKCELRQTMLLNVWTDKSFQEQNRAGCVPLPPFSLTSFLTSKDRIKVQSESLRVGKDFIDRMASPGKWKRNISTPYSLKGKTPYWQPGPFGLQPCCGQGSHRLPGAVCCTGPVAQLPQPHSAGPSDLSHPSCSWPSPGRKHEQTRELWAPPDPVSASHMAAASPSLGKD